MGTGIRLLLSLILAALLEFLFVKGSISILKPPKREINRVIKISLVRPERRVERVRVERSFGQSKKEEAKVKKTPEPKVESTKPKREVAEKSREEKRKGGSLKPLQGNLPVSYIDAVRRAIEESIFYPLEAIEKGIEGPVTVRFSLNREGRAVECKPLSGNAILSEATCTAIREAKFPPIPPSIKNDTLTFELQIEFNLKKALGG